MFPQGHAFSGIIVAAIVVVMRHMDNNMTCLLQCPEAAVMLFWEAIEHNLLPCGQDTPWHQSYGAHSYKGAGAWSSSKLSG